MPRTGLGLNGSTAPVAPPSAAPRETDTALAAAETRARGAAPQKSQARAEAAQPQPRIPRFSDDPLRAIAFALSEGALAFAGRPTNLPGLLQLEAEDERAAQADALAREGLKLRQAALGLNALEQVATTLPSLKPEQTDAFIESLPEVPGIDLKAMALAARDGQLAGLETTVAALKADPTAMMFLSDADMAGKSPAEVKKLADKVLAFKAEIAGTAAKEAIKAGGPQTTIAKLLADRDKALKAGKDGDAAALQARIDKLNESAGPNIVKLQDARDDAIRENRGDDARQIQAQIDKLGTVVGRTPQDIAAASAARGRGRTQEEGRVEAAQRGLEITNIGALLSDARELPEGAQGLTGVFAETVGGFIGQADKDLGQAFTRFATGGATTEELTQFRTQARTAIAANIQTVTGEESGRFTEMERRVTEETIKALQAGASKTQVLSAVGELLKLKLMLRSFAFLKAGIVPKYDLSASGPELKDNATAFVADMRRFGMDDDQIKDAFMRLQTMQAEVAPVFAQ